MSNSFLKKFFFTAAAFSCLASTVQAAPETLSINLKTSHYMDMHKTVKRIAVGNPSVATVIQLPGSASEFLIVTKEAPGSTSLFVWTVDGVRHEYLIVVTPEDPGQAMLIEQAIGLPDVHVKMVGGRILLTGTVENQYEKNYALQTARLFVNGSSNSSILVGSGFDINLETQSATSGGSGDLDATRSEARGQIIDLLQIRHPTQIRLEAQIIEINSDNAKELGIQYGTSGSGGIFSFGEDYTRTDEPRSFRNNPIRWTEQHFSPINATIRALITQNKARLLSRPSVMTLSGEQATIQIGGQIPYTVHTNEGWSTQFKDYGIILQFRPVVDSQNRINSMIHAEVSTINGETGYGQPILATRRADSVINLNSGSPIVIGGLMDSTETKTVQKIPLLGDIPILGEFFKHTSKSKNKQEIIIIVTPFLVEQSEISNTHATEPMREWIAEKQTEHRETDGFDTLNPYEEPELVSDEQSGSERILPPSRINPKTGKLDKKTDESRDDNAVYIAPEDAEDPFGK